MTDAEKVKLLAWILKKWGIPEDATEIDVHGVMHIAHHQAHGYRTYIISHKCEDKQGEIVRLTVRVKELEAENKRSFLRDFKEHPYVCGLEVAHERDRKLYTELFERAEKLEEALKESDGRVNSMQRDYEAEHELVKATVCGLQEIAAELYSDPGLRAQEILTMVGASIDKEEVEGGREDKTS